MPNQPRAIRAKNRFWPATARRKAGGHENFFVAKNRDSESALRAFHRSRRRAMGLIAYRWLNARITKTAAGQAFPAILTLAGIILRA